MNPLISIIIPIYNVEAYLKTCLDSVMKQRYRNFEVIMVNDGTQDGSAEIAQNYVNQDSRFRLFHQSNQGLSAARNTGLNHVNGQYVFYLDSDDRLMDTALELLVNAAEKNQAEVVQANFYYDCPDYLLLNKQQKESVIIYTSEEAMWELLDQKTVLNFAWGKLIQTNIARECKFPVGKFFEDTFWISQIIHRCHQYVALQTPILYYLQRSVGISGGFSIRNLDQLEEELKRIEFLKENYADAYYKKALALLNKKILLHKKLLKHLNQQEQNKYLKKINEIEKKYHLKRLFPFSYIGISQYFNRLKERSSASEKWERILK